MLDDIELVDKKSMIKCIITVKNDVIYKVSAFVNANDDPQKGNDFFKPEKMSEESKIEFRDMVNRFKEINNNGKLLEAINLLKNEGNLIEVDENFTIQMLDSIIAEGKLNGESS